MGLVESKRPVVLIVEDEFLLRMDAVDMIAAAGFEVVEAGNADRSDRNSGIPSGHHRGFHRYPDARLDGRIETCPGGQGPLASDQDRRHLRPPRCGETDLPEGGRFLPKPYSPMQVTGVLRELTTALTSSVMIAQRATDTLKR